MATLKELQATAEAVGATVKDNGDDAYDADAPIGSVWASDGIHMLTSVYRQWNHIETGARLEARNDLLDRMRAGLSPCDDPTCDYCTEEA